MSKARDLADGIAGKLDTTDAPVIIDTSSPPTVGQVLKATSPIAAEWQTDYSTSNLKLYFLQGG